MKNVTIQDIADEAKVSKATVSRVLNNTSAVSPEKRRAILEATDRLGFEPNVVARSLANGRSMTIGVLTQNIGSPFYDAISQGVIAGLGDTGYCPVFVDGQWQRGIEVEAIRALLGRRVDGLVLIGGEVLSDELEELCSPLPTIVVARRLPPAQHHCIYTDNFDGGYRATRCLLENGHREIAFIRGILHHPDAIDRFEGYRRALLEAGLALDPKLVLDGDFTAESGVRAIEELIARKQPFSAVFAANDTTAFGARLALYRRGIHVPDEVSIIGFDDQAEAAYMAPPLATIRQPGKEMGERASRALLDLIAGKPFESESLSGELQLRESVARRA
jgi:LacI family transcriptional regulator